MARKRGGPSPKKKRDLRRRVKKAMRALGVESKRDRAKFVRRVRAEKRILLEQELGITDPRSVKHLTPRISLRRLLERPAEKEVRARYYFDRKFKRFRDRETGRVKSVSDVRRSVSVTAYWKQVRFLSRITGLTVKEARGAFSALRDADMLPEDIYR